MYYVGAFKIRLVMDEKRSVLTNAKSINITSWHSNNNNAADMLISQSNSRVGYLKQMNKVLDPGSRRFQCLSNTQVTNIALTTFGKRFAFGLD